MNASRPALVTTAALTAILLIALGQGSIASTDDALYAQMAREMAESGRWLTATWLGVEVFEKPPLLLWLLRLTGPLFGWSEFSLRLPGVLGAAVALFYGCRLANEDAESPWSGLVAGLLTIATVTFTFNARRPMTDPLLCGAVMASLWYASRLVCGPDRRAAIGLGVAGGLGLLAKWVAMGPAALVCAVVLAYERRWRSIGVATVTALLVAGPWFAAMTATHGVAFWDVFLGYHVVDRAGGALVGAAPLSMYVETYWALDGVLGLVLVLGLAWSFAARRTAVTWLVAGTAVVTLVAIHVASTRLYHYVMPVVPLLAVGTAIAASRRREVLVLVAALGLVGFVSGPLDPTLLRPDYAPTSKVIGESLRDAPADTTVVLWEDYDPALTWYSGRPVRIWTQSESMASIQSSIDMMRRAGAVVFATPERLRALGSRSAPVIFVAPRERSAGLLAWVSGLAPGRLRVDRETASSHLLVHLGPAT